MDYTVIPDWTELGFEIIAMTLIKAKRSTEATDKAKKWILNNPNIVFSAGGEGMGMDYSIISLHKDYSDYSSFMSNLKTAWSGNLQDVRSFLMATNMRKIVKPLSLKYLEKTWEETN